MKNQLILTGIAVILIGGAAFFGGINYQKGKAMGPGRNGQGDSRVQDGNHAGGLQGRGNGGIRPVSGEIMSQDDKSITVKLQDGTSRLVVVSNTTQINKTQEATKSDLKTGERVAVFGTENADGSVTAQNIQLNPQFRGGSDTRSPTPSPGQ